MTESSLLLRLRDVSHRFGGGTLFSSVNVDVHAGDRIALVGHNGSGKSTLLRMLDGQLEPEFGDRICDLRLILGYLPQGLSIDGYQTLGDIARADLPAGLGHRVHIATRGLRFDDQVPVTEASGGELRKAAIARLLAVENNVLLLDEPTNHLDVESILWLESTIRELPAAVIIVSHDRALLRAVTSKTMWIDRGKVRMTRQGYEGFDRWKEQTLAQEAATRRKLDKRIEAESQWAMAGISARRKRNQGRLRALEQLRLKREVLGKARVDPSFDLANSDIDSRLVLEARHVSHSFGSQPIISDFSIRIMKGDRVAIVGPNGSGKTTLLKVLTRQLRADKGIFKTGYRCRMAAMWQNREKVNPNISVQQFLAGRGAKARDRPDYVIFGGRSRHVKSYIRDFQFKPWQSDSPIAALSGGEWGRLLLARILLEDCNLLVLDEPTNDLDVDMLDRLQDTLANFDGTVLFVSHDREFLDNVATLTIASAGAGRWVAYSGGWSDYVALAGPVFPEPGTGNKGKACSSRQPGRLPKRSELRGMTFTERHRLEMIPTEVIALEQEIARLERRAGSEDIMRGDFKAWAELSRKLEARQGELEELEGEWLRLLEKSEEDSRRHRRQPS